MNQEEMLQWLVENVPELGKTKEEVMANVNALVKTEGGKEKLLKLIEEKQRNKTNKMKNGGKVEYLQCLKKGGSIKDCGCGKKMPKAASGTQMPEKKERKDANGQAFIEADGTQVLTRRGSGNYSVSSTVDGEYTAPYRTEKRVSYDYMGTPIDSTFIVHNQHVDAPSTTKYRPNPSFLQKLFGWKDYNGQFDNAYKVNFEQEGGDIPNKIPFINASFTPKRNRRNAVAPSQKTMAEELSELRGNTGPAKLNTIVTMEPIHKTYVPQVAPLGTQKKQEYVDLSKVLNLKPTLIKLEK